MPSFNKPTHRIVIPALPHGERRSFAPEGMTERQLQCLSWVQEGKSATDIGAILGISGRTVEWHLMSVCNLLGVRTRLQAVLKARDLGVLDASAP